MTKTHEAVIIHDDTKDIMKHMKIACSQVKAKLNIHDFVIPIDWIARPYGYIVVVEVPNNNGALRGRNASEVGSRKAKD
jgi:hypothetical protein